MVPNRNIPQMPHSPAKPPVKPQSNLETVIIIIFKFLFYFFILIKF